MSNEAVFDVEDNKSKKKAQPRLVNSLLSLNKKKEDEFTRAKRVEPTNAEFTEDFASENEQVIPERINPQKSEKKSSKKTGGSKALPLFAILLAGCALAWNYYEFNNNKAEFVNLKGQAGTFESVLASLNPRIDEIQLKQHSFQNSLGEETGRINQLEKSQLQFAQIRKELAALSSELSSLNSKLADNSAAIKKNVNAIEEARNHAELVGKKISQRAAANKKASIAMTSTQNNVAEAELVSLDRWGSAITAMMKIGTQWLPLNLGDRYKGWKFTSVEGDKAVFSKGKKKVRLQVKE